jgi:hypothetical protein
MLTNRLVFDPTDANTLASSSNVGAYVRAGNDGDLIASQLISGEEWLNTAAALHDGAGTALTSTLVGSDQALDVNIVNSLTVDVDLDGIYNVSTNADPDNVGIIAHTRAASLTDTQQVERTTADNPDTDSIAPANVVGLDVNAFMLGFDGTNWERVRTYDGGFKVADVADTAIENTQTLVSTTAVNVVASALADRSYLGMANEGNKTLYYGKTGVTTTNGFPLHPGQKDVWRIGASVAVQAIGRAGASNEDMRVMEAS